MIKIIFPIFISFPFLSMTQTPNITSVTPLSMEVGKYEKFEAKIDLTASFTNPYDYEQIVLTGVFTAPNGQKDTIEGFFLQDFELNTNNGNLTTKGVGEWRMRFAPNEVGTWQYDISVQTPTATSTAFSGSFSCKSAGNKGFVRKNTTNYLNFDNGTPYIPVGQNLCWQSGNPYLSYNNWLNKMGAAKANFMRLWLCHWGLGLEWKKDVNTGYEGLKKYKQNNAWYIDWLLEKCHEQGIYIMFCINHHGQVSTETNPEWGENPYNTANGGMCTQTSQFFTDINAKNVHKNRLRYIVARWGYSPQIMTWELFNEVNWTDNYTTNTVKTAVRNWHSEMAQYLKNIDPFQHLVSTSYAKDDDPELWQLEHIDFTQTHNYLGVPNIEKAISIENAQFVTEYKKPNFNGEFGINANTGQETKNTDPKGIHLHNVMWATAFGGAMGAGATWWWDTYTEPQNLYKEFTPLSIVLQKIDFIKDNYKPTKAVVQGGTGDDLSVSPSADYGQATESKFTVDKNGISVGRLGQYLYGSQWNTQYRNPPIFTAVFIVAGKFVVKTANERATSPRISIYLDGVLVLDKVAGINQTFSIDVPIGTHTIKVDNLGTDWVRISEYLFTGVGVSPINAYVLKSENDEKAAGWLHNRRYNWKELQTNTPPSVSNTNLSLAGMTNGRYDIQFYSCSTGELLSSTSANNTGLNVTVPIPNLPWDLAFTATRTSAVSTDDIVEKNIKLKIYPNPLYIGDILTLDTEGVPTGEWVLSFVNLSGQVIRTEKVQIEQNIPLSIQTTGLQEGLFILTLNNGQKAAFTRVKLMN